VPSTIERLGPSRVKMTLTVPFSDLQPAIDKAYKDIASRVNLPGFRKGHVPPAMIDQRFGRGTVLQEAINEQLPDAYGAAVAEHKLSPLGQPHIDIVRLDDGSEVELAAEFDVRPDFDLPDVSGITVTVPSAVVGDDAVDERLDLLRTRFATYKDLDRAAEAGDVVHLDISASRDGVPLSGTEAAGMTYVVGSGGLVEGLDSAISGLAAGESKTFATTLVGGDHAGESADVTVTVNRVQQRVLARVDDDFAQMVSEYDTADQMRDGLRDSLERIERLGQLNAARDQVLDALIDGCDFEVPEQVLADDIQSRHDEVENQLARAGLSLDRYLAEAPDEESRTPEEFWERMDDQASKGLKARLILDKLAEAQSVAVTQEDLSAFIVAKADEDGVTPDQEAQHMMEHNHMGDWMGEIRRSKALTTLVSQVSARDTDGRRVDLGAIRSDGTLGEITAAEAGTASPAGAKSKGKAAKK